MEKVINQQEVNFITSNGYISILIEGMEVGFYRTTDDKTVAYRYFQKGREFRVFSSTTAAQSWILNN